MTITRCSLKPGWLAEDLRRASERVKSFLPPRQPSAAERIAVLEAEKEKLRAALRPFAAAVFNDNGDMTVSSSRPTYDDFCNAYFAMKATG